MLPKRERLSRAQFPKGRGVSTPFSFGTVRTFPADSYKASVVISKKTLRRAVDRHKGKRKAYNALRALNSSNSKQVYVFYPNQTILTEKLSVIVQTLKKRFS